MAKHIKLELVAPETFNKVLVRVVEQTNFGKAFGNKKGDLRKFVASNGLTIASNVRPAKDENFKETQTIWLQGEGTAEQNASCIVVSRKTAEKLKEAVEEYNFYYTPAEINKRVRAKRAREAEYVAKAAFGEAAFVAALASFSFQEIVG